MDEVIYTLKHIIDNYNLSMWEQDNVDVAIKLLRKLQQLMEAVND